MSTHRITNRLDGLTTSLIAWKQFESGLTEFKEALGKDKGALKGLTGAQEELRNVDAGSNDVATRQNSYHKKIPMQQVSRLCVCIGRVHRSTNKL